MARLPDAAALGETPSPQPAQQARTPITLDTRTGFETVPSQVMGQSADEMQRIGDAMITAQAHIQSRADTIERVRAIGAYKELGTNELLRRATEDDFSKPSAMIDYGKLLSAKRDELVSKHSGTADSKALLFEQLERERFTMSAHAAKTATEAQTKLLDSTLSGKLNVLSNKAYNDPANIAQHFLDVDREISDLAPALTPNQEIKFKQVGRAQVAKMAIESFIDRGAFGEAERVLNTPGVAEVLGEEAQRSAYKHIAEQKYAIRNAAMKKLGEASIFRQALELELGRPPTDHDLAVKAGVASKTENSDNIFGTGTTGRSLGIITQYAPAYAQGLLTPGQERIFEAAVTHYQQPQMFFNPNTGQPEWRKNTLPAFVQEALKRSPRSAGSNDFVTVPGAAEELLGRPYTPEEAAGMDQLRAATLAKKPLTLTIDPNTGQPAPAPSPAAAATKPALPGNRTVWDSVADSTGPVPAMMEHAGRIPGIGELVPAGKFTQARRFVELQSNDLVRVLQNNPKYAEGERKAIAKEVEIDPKVWDTDTAAKNRLIAIDEALAMREAQAIKIADPKSNVGREERIHAMNVAAAIMNFRKNLGIPPMVKTPAEARALPSGTEFRTPQDAPGVTRRVP